MNKDKQIEEMAKAICHAPTCEIRKNGGTCYKYCKAYIYAFRAVNAGYRKASDVAREIFEEIEKWASVFPIENNCAIVSLDLLAELKKKYTEGEG
jgi:hypothetical protein